MDDILSVLGGILIMIVILYILGLLFKDKK